ncbi:MAG: hypothetical protein IJM44_04200, partial [Ruminococcus sp.]|nr:hypothetical protein [Ruminococcus sp.]
VSAPDVSAGDNSGGEDLAGAFKLVAGEYKFVCMSSAGILPDGFAAADVHTVSESFKADPLSISESGVLHFNGKDYQLTAQKLFHHSDGEYIIFSVDSASVHFENISGDGIAELSKAGIPNGELAFVDQTYEGPVLVINEYDGSVQGDMIRVCLSFDGYDSYVLRYNFQKKS